MSMRLSGINPLSYQGVEAPQPPLLVQEHKDPVTTDLNYNVGTLWLTANTPNVWMLVSVANEIATWVLLFPGGGVAITYVENLGSATAALGVLNILGGTNVTTTGAGNTVTINISGTIAREYDANVGIAIPSLGNLAIVGDNLITTTGSGNTITIDLDNSTNGQTLIGGGAMAQWADITSLGGTLAITHPGPNTINLEATGTGSGATEFDTDSGNATFLAGAISIVGGSNINTSGSGNTVVTNLDNTVSIAGSLTASTTITAGTGLLVTTGGIDSTGTTTLTSLGAGVMQTNAVSTVSSTNGTNGQVLIGGGTAPTWNNITSTGGTVAITNTANHINLEVAGSIPPSSRAAFLASLNADGVTWTIIYDTTNSVKLTPYLQFVAPISGYYWIQFYQYTGTVSTYYSVNTNLMSVGGRLWYLENIVSNTPTTVPSASNPPTGGRSFVTYIVAGDILFYSSTAGYTPGGIGGGSTTNITTWISGYLAA